MDFAGLLVNQVIIFTKNQRYSRHLMNCIYYYEYIHTMNCIYYYEYI